MDALTFPKILIFAVPVALFLLLFFLVAVRSRRDYREMVARGRGRAGAGQGQASAFGRSSSSSSDIPVSTFLALHADDGHGGHSGSSGTSGGDSGGGGGDSGGGGGD